MKKPDFQVTFWGVRGSIPVPGLETIKYGGNTSCVQLQIGKRLFILDAGSGIIKLGQHLLKAKKPIEGSIFITHTHWDHIQGFPFFAPAFMRGNKFTLYGPNDTEVSFVELMEGQMVYQYFPVRLNSMGADMSFHELLTGLELDMGDEITVKTVHNNHPNGGLSYRFDHAGRSCCYVTDNEHFACINTRLKDFIKEADLVIYDCHFTDEEYPQYIGWGHSTWQEGVKMVEAAGAQKLVLFHHANYRTDDEMEKIEKQAQERYPDSLAAREGLTVKL